MPWAFRIDLQNPGMFALGGQDPRPAIAFHGSSYANGIISVDGSISAGDVGNITIGANTYTYSVQSTDTLASIRDAFIALINSNSEEVVTASAAPAFTRILLQAKVPGPEGDWDPDRRESPLPPPRPPRARPRDWL